ncbi:CzcE family metal-binding protein [Oxalobacteraceae bacterium R-40]|uniref:CzcE family metal-binding protein n=1 Tax=Keguizhuia sedimenti TaxID=3064264 RepID=A0ABU1BIG9_9BURK|nr:CzcE family metal-binding protein [Oxalobacteraceae bacterium R-40]
MRSLLLSVCVIVLMGCASIGGEPPLDLLGNSAAVGTGVKTIVITPQTRHVNVTGGEIIDFRVGEKAFAWHFFVATTVSAFDLKRVAPPGMLDHSVIAYVAPDPRYCCRNGSDRGR